LFSHYVVITKTTSKLKVKT